METAITVDDLTKTYQTGVGRRTRTAVSGLSLRVRPGQIEGLLGPNGAGKTTTLKSVMGFIRPTSGNVSIFGRDARDSRVHAKVGFLPEQPYFHGHMRADGALDFYGRLCGLSADVRKARSARLLELVGLSESAHMRLSKFSRGMLQRMGIAQALIQDPELVILDEPASGLDPIGQKEMRRVILSLKEQGKTVFLSSHQLSEVEEVCDSVSILDGGKLRREGTLDDLLNVSGANSITASGRAKSDVREALGALADEVIASADSYTISAQADRTYEVLKVLQEQGLVLGSVEPKRLKLEDYFIELVRGGRDGD